MGISSIGDCRHIIQNSYVVFVKDDTFRGSVGIPGVIANILVDFIAAQYSKHKHGEECPNENSCDECDDIPDHRLIENVSFYFVDDVLSSIEAFYGII